MTDVSAAWRKAASFAARSHDGQRRKDGRTPYVTHPFRVAMTIVREFRLDDEVALLAALLHDTIEDTRTDRDDLAGEFGPEVAGVVAALTKDKRLPFDERERAYHEALRAGPWQARAVKLADTWDNWRDSLTPEMRARAGTGLVRALELAAGDPQLAAARSLVGADLEAGGGRDAGSGGPGDPG